MCSHRLVGSSEIMETPKHPLMPKKGLKGFLLVEFQKGALLVRLRFKVILTSSSFAIEIRESGSKWSEGIFRQNRIAIGDHISERRLFETMAEYISDKEKVPVDSVIFRWQSGSLRLLPKSEVSAN